MYWKEEGNTLDMNDATHIINSKIEENEWLDYKQEWHQNKIELVRDILSFANTVHSRDCYLIFGVVDKTIEVIGTRGDSNKKNTQQVADLLAHQQLSGDPPKIKVETFEINGKEVDVLTVFNYLNVPLFLYSKRSYQGKEIQPGQVFTRVSDTNTPTNETASDSVLEMLFKKRFRLDQTIYERYRYVMEQLDDWTYVDEESKLLYNFDPNFYIEIKPLDSEEEASRIHDGDYYGWLVKSGLEWNIRNYNVVTAMYGQHKILDFSYLFNFDRGRGLIITPKLGHLGRNKDCTYHYLVKDSPDWKFMSLFIAAWNNSMSEEFNSSYYSTPPALDNIVIYESENEREEVEERYGYDTTVEDLEDDFNSNIEPTDCEIAEIRQKNSEYGRLSLVQNNIARVVSNRLHNNRLRN
ncbi:ATP-binding protein [Leuconostoc mesenteroides]|uniref:ATP-binding protein n=1 Tax=Leuconostoc mesenteroides TaxID=1245 RepID=UPI002361BE5C|nr:ATP-binding protein [Leuconostoc mesenteroides]